MESILSWASQHCTFWIKDTCFLPGVARLFLWHDPASVPCCQLSLFLIYFLWLISLVFLLILLALLYLPINSVGSVASSKELQFREPWSLCVYVLIFLFILNLIGADLCLIHFVSTTSILSVLDSQYTYWIKETR